MMPRQTATVSWLSEHKSISKRLADLGFVPGAPVTCVLSKAKGELSAFLIRGAVIALRREDAQLVLVCDDIPEVTPTAATSGDAQTNDSSDNIIKSDSTGGTTP